MFELVAFSVGHSMIWDEISDCCSRKGISIPDIVISGRFLGSMVRFWVLPNNLSLHF